MMTMTIENADAVAKAMAQAPALAAKWLGLAGNAAVAEMGKRTRKGKMPYDTGALAQTFQSKVSSKEVRYFPTRFYAPFVYFGTSRGIKPDPYLDRILDESSKDIQKHYTEAINQVLGEIASATKAL